MTSVEVWFCWHSKPHSVVTISGLRWSSETFLILLRVTAGHKMLDSMPLVRSDKVSTLPPTMMKWHDLVQICIFVICNIYIYIFTSLYTLNETDINKLAFLEGVLVVRASCFGSGYEKGLSWRVNDYLAGVGEEMIGMWKYCEVIRDHEWMNPWIENIQLNEMTSTLSWMWFWHPPAQCRWMLPGQQ